MGTEQEEKQPKLDGAGISRNPVKYFPFRPFLEKRQSRALPLIPDCHSLLPQSRALESSRTFPSAAPCLSFPLPIPGFGILLPPWNWERKDGNALELGHGSASSPPGRNSRENSAPFQGANLWEMLLLLCPGDFPAPASLGNFPAPIPPVHDLISRRMLLPCPDFPEGCSDPDSQEMLRLPRGCSCPGSLYPGPTGRFSLSRFLFSL